MAAAAVPLRDTHDLDVADRIERRVDSVSVDPVDEAPGPSVRVALGEFVSDERPLVAGVRRFDALVSDGDGVRMCDCPEDLDALGSHDRCAFFGEFLDRPGGKPAPRFEVVRIGADCCVDFFRAGKFPTPQVLVFYVAEQVGGRSVGVEVTPREHCPGVLQVEFDVMWEGREHVFHARVCLEPVPGADMVIQHDEPSGGFGQFAEGFIGGGDIDEANQLAVVTAAFDGVVVPVSHVAALVPPGAPCRPGGSKAVGAAGVEVADPLHLEEDTVSELEIPVADSERPLRLAWRSLPPGSDPLRAFEALRVRPNPWLLDSALRGPRLGRYSFAGTASRVIRTSDFEALRRALPALERDVKAPPVPFVGGAVALLAYEFGARVEPVEFTGVDDLCLPDATLMVADKVVAWDHETGEGWACALGVGRDADRSLDELLGWLEACPPPRKVGQSPSRAFGAEPTGFDEGMYAKAVDQVKQEIGAGNVYQANLTHRMERAFDGDAWALYRELRRTNPAPFACFVELPEIAVIGSSPERFLQVDLDGCVESRPIKGTRPRGRHAAEDAVLRGELASSEKDRAENLMIVDLVRNDLGRVCETGSVGVPELMTIEEYASVFHLVSTVTGRLRADCDLLDLVHAAFPPGSMTGAPKIAAMRLLDRLEPVRRGLYAGAIGYLDARGSMDLAVVIRTLFVREGRALAHAGGGVVADSDPHAEWRESQDKAEPLLAALAAVQSA